MGPAPRDQSARDAVVAQSVAGGGAAVPTVRPGGTAGGSLPPRLGAPSGGLGAAPRGWGGGGGVALPPGLSPAAGGRAQAPPLPPKTTAFGALLNHTTGGHIVSDDEPGNRSFHPMNANSGLFPPVEAPKVEGKRLRGKDKTVAKRHAITSRALADCKEWLGLPLQ